MSYVYVITDDDLVENFQGYLTNTKHVKIGYTSGEVLTRIAQLQTGNPRPINPLYIFHFDSPETAKAIERLCHNKLKNSRASGEWFLYGEPVFKFLKIIEEIAINTERCTVPDEEAFNQHWEKYQELKAASNG